MQRRVAAADRRAVRREEPEAIITISDNSPSGAVYKGLALAYRTNGGPTLYATNFHNGTVDVFDSSFHLVTTLPATAFKDPNLPANFAPFGIADIDGQLYVTFALRFHACFLAPK